MPAHLAFAWVWGIWMEAFMFCSRYFNHWAITLVQLLPSYRHLLVKKLKEYQTPIWLQCSKNSGTEVRCWLCQLCCAPLSFSLELPKWQKATHRERHSCSFQPSWSQKNWTIRGKGFSYTDGSTRVHSRVRKDHCFGNLIAIPLSDLKKSCTLGTEAEQSKWYSAASVKAIYVKGCFTHNNVSHIQSRNEDYHHWNQVSSSAQ